MPAGALLCNLRFASARRVLMPCHGNSWLKSPTQAGWRCNFAVSRPLDKADERDGAEAPLADLLTDACHVYPVAERRLPLRARNGLRTLMVATSAYQGQTAARKSPTQKKKKMEPTARMTAGRHCLLGYSGVRKTRFSCLKLALTGCGSSQHLQHRRNFACLLNACEHSCCGGCECHFRTCPGLAVVGVLGPQAPLESAAAHVCRDELGHVVWCLCHPASTAALPRSQANGLPPVGRHHGSGSPARPSFRVGAATDILDECGGAVGVPHLPGGCKPSALPVH